MELTVIGSSSRGNCYALQSSTETLVLEAGCKLASFKKTFDYKYKPIIGVLVSHSHGDHCKYVKEFSHLGATIYSTPDVISLYGIENFDVAMKEGKTYQVGSFRVTPFSLYHDVPCFGYLIWHKEMGSLFFATDTFALPVCPKNVDHWLIEANYDDDILQENVENGMINPKQADRIRISHLSLANTINILQLSEADKSKDITLIHLSSRNSDAKAFTDAVTAEFGAPTHVAKKGLKVNISKEI